MPHPPVSAPCFCENAEQPTRSPPSGFPAPQQARCGAEARAAALFELPAPMPVRLPGACLFQAAEKLSPVAAAAGAKIIDASQFAFAGAAPAAAPTPPSRLSPHLA